MATELSNILVKHGKISQEQADKALKLVKSDSEKFEAALVKIGAVESEYDIAQFIGKHLKIGALKLSDIELNPDIVKLKIGRASCRERV